MMSRLLPAFAALPKQGCLPVSQWGLVEVPALAGGAQRKVWSALTAQFLLPFHLVVEEGRLVEEITDFAALLILLRGGKEPVLGLLGEELADARHGEDYLLHASVQAHNLQEAGRRGGCRQILPLPGFGFLLPRASCAFPSSLPLHQHPHVPNPD